MKTPQAFVDALAELDLPDVFNPYRDCCPVHDRSDAARLRKANFAHCLEAALEARVDTIWIARDLGYRGGRRTGLPLTDEVNLRNAGQLLGGVSLRRATRGPVVAERTAAIVWRMLTQISEPVVLWNVFPLHPHEPSNQFSNRCHTRRERDATWPFLMALVEMIRPRRVVAIGRDAAAALDDFEIPVITVRHPSYGGQADFVAGLQAIYGLSKDAIEPRTLELPL